MANDKDVPFLEDPASGFILDTTQVVQEHTLHAGIIHRDGRSEYYFGFLLPKTEKKLRKGEVVGEHVVYRPAIVTSQRVLFPADDHLENFGKLSFSEAPIQKGLPRMSLETISGWTKGDRQALTGKDIFEQVRTVLEQYLYYHDPRFYDIDALWILGTYFQPCFSAYPYREFTSMRPDAGKTKALTLFAALTYNGRLFVKPTSPTLFRLVERNGPTLCLDEVEKLAKQGPKGHQEVSDILELINSGYARGATVTRWDKNDEGTLVMNEFSTFCPKVFAGLAALDGLDATRSRTITSIMLPPPDGDPRGDREVTSDPQQFQNVRDQLYLYAIENGTEIWSACCDEGQFRLPKEFKLRTRAWQIWKPLLALAFKIDPELYKRMGVYAEELTQEVKDDQCQDSWDSRFWKGLISLVTEEKEYEASDIVQSVRTFFPINEPPSDRWVGFRMKKAGFYRFKRRKAHGIMYLLSPSVVADTASRLGHPVPPEYPPQAAPPAQTTLPLMEDVKDMQLVKDVENKDEGG